MDNRLIEGLDIVVKNQYDISLIEKELRNKRLELSKEKEYLRTLVYRKSLILARNNDVLGLIELACQKFSDIKILGYIRRAVYSELSRDKAQVLFIKVAYASTENTKICYICKQSTIPYILTKNSKNEIEENSFYLNTGPLYGDMCININKETITHLDDLRVFCSNQCRSTYLNYIESKKKNSNEQKIREQEEKREYINKLKTMPYSDYLKTEHWADLRKYILKKQHYTCQLCNKQNVKLNVHHKTYIRRGEEHISDLIVLCEECHRRHHGIKEDFC